MGIPVIGITMTEPELSLDEVFASNGSNENENNNNGKSPGKTKRRGSSLMNGSWGYASFERKLDLNQSVDFGRQQSRMQQILDQIQEDHSHHNPADKSQINEKNDNEEEDDDDMLVILDGNQHSWNGSFNASFGENGEKAPPPFQLPLPKRLHNLSKKRQQLTTHVNELNHDLHQAVADVETLQSQMKTLQMQIKQRTKLEVFKEKVAEKKTKKKLKKEAIVNTTNNNDNTQGLDLTETSQCSTRSEVRMNDSSEDVAQEGRTSNIDESFNSARSSAEYNDDDDQLVDDSAYYTAKTGALGDSSRMMDDNRSRRRRSGESQDVDESMVPLVGNDHADEEKLGEQQEMDGLKLDDDDDDTNSEEEQKHLYYFDWSAFSEEQSYFFDWKKHRRNSEQLNQHPKSPTKSKTRSMSVPESEAQEQLLETAFDWKQWRREQQKGKLIYATTT